MDITKISTINDAINFQTSIGKSSSTSSLDFKSMLAGEINPNNYEDYKKYLSEKFGGRITIESIPKDQRSLEKAGGRMGGRDVIIAPNIFDKMLNDKETANYYENHIKNIFDNIPKYKKEAAAMGLTFESCGVVVHEDGTVTHICGGGDTPERVAEVNRINAEKRKKRWQRIDMMNELLDEKFYMNMMNQKYIQNHSMSFFTVI